MSNFSDDMDGYQWENHFKTLFMKHECNIDSNIETIRNVNNGKAVGSDSIHNEYLKHTTPELLGLIQRFIKLNINTGLTPSYWCINLISPIHKVGPKKDPDNYRGICIITHY